MEQEIPAAFPAQPGALQMTDAELATESARSRGVGLLSVLAVACYTGFVFTQWLALREWAGGDQAKLLLSIDAHKLAYIASGFFFSVASIVTAAVLAHIVLAARSRSKLVPKITLIVTVAGPVLLALVYPIYVIGQVSAASDFSATSVQSIAAANQLLSSGLAEVSTAAWKIGQTALGVAWVITGIYGIRVGLLTRLVGAVAVAIGAASMIAPPLGGLLSVFWIGAFAITMLGESTQVPPAWKLGRPVTWREVAAIGREVNPPPQS